MKKTMKKRLLCYLASATILMIGMTTTAATVNRDHIKVTGFDKNVDYTAKIVECLNDGSSYAMEIGAIYEKQRNLKIDTLKLDATKTYYFDTYDTAEDILNAMFPPEPEPPKYSEEDLYWLSRVVYAEAGCNWFPNWVQQDVASVVLNRVTDSRYPDTIKGVIFDPGQYSCVDSGSIYNQPTQKVIDNCRYVLENGSTLPSYIIGQSGYPLGPVYKSYTDYTLGTTIYFFSC